MNHRWNAKKGWKRCLRCGMEGFRGLPPLRWTLWTRETGLFFAVTLPSCVKSRFPSTRLEMVLAQMEARALERMARYYAAPALLAGSGEDSATARAQKGTHRYTYTFYDAKAGREDVRGLLADVKPTTNRLYSRLFGKTQEGRIYFTKPSPPEEFPEMRAYRRVGKRWRRVR